MPTPKKAPVKKGTVTARTIDPAEDRKLLTQSLEATEESILSSFIGLPNSYTPSDTAYVYVAGTKPVANRLLLCAHADTVNTRTHDGLLKSRWFGDICTRVDNTMFGGWKKGAQYDFGHALGGDDRAGCAALWRLRDSGHSLLVTTGEESGLVGARAATKAIGPELKQHAFAIQIDRRGDRQAVFYDVSTNEFEHYILDLLNVHDIEQVPWSIHQGSCSDISHICDVLRMCGVNLSAGFLKEHTGEEMLLLNAWQHTLYTLQRVVALEHKTFVLPPKARLLSATQTWRKGNSTYGQGGGADYGATHRDPKGYIGASLLANNLISVYFVRPLGGVPMSKKRHKRLVGKIEKLVAQRKIGAERGLILLDEMTKYQEGARERATTAKNSKAVIVRNFPGRCDCARCLVLVETMRHVHGCICYMCRPHNMPYSVARDQVERKWSATQNNGRHHGGTVCVHRCMEPGCPGTDGAGGWSHVKDRPGTRCEYEASYLSPCPTHAKGHTH